MQNYREIYDNECLIEREDTGDIITGELLIFKPKEYMKVVIGNSVAVNLQYESRHSVYVGEKAGMPFVTKGPKKLK